MLVDFFKETYNVETAQIDSCAEVTRVHVLTDILMSGSKRLIDHYELLVDQQSQDCNNSGSSSSSSNNNNAAMAETLRIQNPPYVTAVHIFFILSWRSQHMKDGEASKFLRRTSKPNFIAVAAAAATTTAGSEENYHKLELTNAVGNQKRRNFFQRFLYSK